MNSKIHTTFATGALLLSMFVAGAAFAGSPDDVRSETVKFQDLNLKTDAGVSTLYQRIHQAARRVCWQSDGALADGNAIARCEEKAENKAIMDVNSPELSAFYQKKTGRPVPMLAKSQ